MKLSQENRDKIRAYAKVFALVFIGITFVLCVSVEVLKLWEEADWYYMVAYIVGYMCDTCAVLSLILVIVMLLMNQRDEDDIDREQAKSPLKDVTPQQEEQIIALLQKVVLSSDGSNKMNRAEVATFLATLKTLNHLEDAGSYNNLRLWVEKVTGSKDEDKRAFNQQYKRALEKIGKTKYTEKLEKILPNTD